MTFQQTTQHPCQRGLVSVVMPAYNAAAFIAEALASVQRQSFPQWELLVVDDGSTDRTPDIVRAHARHEPRIRLLRNARGKGVSGARNTGIEQARGEFIAFLDADDIWEPEKLAAQIAVMRRTGCALSATSYRMVNEHGLVLRTVRVPSRLTYRTLLKGNRIGCLTAVYSQRLLGKVYMPADFEHEDYVTWLGIVQSSGPAVGLNTALARYRKRGDSLSAPKLQAATWQWNIYRRGLGLPWAVSAYLFLNYAVRGVFKHWA